MGDSNFKNSRVTIGIKNFNMKINIAKESKELRKNARKIGDKTGIGFSEDTEDHKAKNSK